MKDKRKFEDYLFSGLGEAGKTVKKIFIGVVILLIIVLVLAIWIL